MELVYQPHSLFELIECFDVPIKFSLETELELLKILKLDPAKERLYNYLVGGTDGASLTLEEQVHIFRHLLFQDIYSITPCLNSEKCQAIWDKLEIDLKSLRLTY